MTTRKQKPTTLEMHISVSKFDPSDGCYDDKPVTDTMLKNPTPEELGRYIIKQCKKGELITFDIEGVWLDEDGVQI
jgi:hypothetical protein